VETKHTISQLDGRARDLEELVRAAQEETVMARSQLEDTRKVEHTHTYARNYRERHINTRTHARAHTYTYTHTHTHIHTHTYTHTHTITTQATARMLGVQNESLSFTLMCIEQVKLKSVTLLLSFLHWCYTLLIIWHSRLAFVCCPINF
jgi:DNA primase